MGTHQFFTQIQQADIIGLADALLEKPGMPFIGPVPAGSVTPTIEHNLNTNDVDVSVYRVTDGVQVGVPIDRLNANTVQLTFNTAPTSGEYRVVVAAGTGAGGPGGGGGGTPDPHAASHAEGGSDPLTALAIGAATDDHTHEGGDHDHAGIYAAVIHAHNGLTPEGGSPGQVLTKDTTNHYEYSWQDATGGGGGGGSSVKPWPPVTLADTDPVNVDASAGTHFRLTLTANRTINTPTNPTPGQIILFEVTASGADRTINLGAGYGAGNDILALAQIEAGKTDYIQCIYDERKSKWQLISYVKGYS